MNSAAKVDSAERRARQRFVAKRRGDVCFWALVNGVRRPLNDLSLEGFSLPVSADLGAGVSFSFVLQREGVPDRIEGRAEVVNQITDGGLRKAGCRFVEIDGEEVERLKEWLIAHVLANATVRINERDATAIVSGPSLI
ncbi:PilZ domain-containing protein [Azoarcus sp. L1K30]|uniref:PilZ domain-containing protein n=1 Tax=Azoarcus sp. L1K30 TaxID=2820277 RepID=UPI002012F9C2|nr:PilZ domain-containing protein [Azoarcus sp. L1K30]